MKKYAKLIGLAGLMLALCLLLTGCQQPPDETVNTMNMTGAEATASRFATLPPAESVTVTPDIDWSSIGIIETNDTPQDSNPSNGNVWDNTGTDPMLPSGTQFPGETPNPAAIAVVTDLPSAVPPTASPTPGPPPPGGERRSTGAFQMQKKLKELGYYKGSADGDFGPATEKAVKAFQKANGLTADGKAGQKTLAKLYGSGSKSSSSSKDTGSSSNAKISKNTYLESGKKGKDVKTLQNRLIELGWLSGSASGTYDSSTEAAVIAFQKKAKLWADGKAGPKTIDKLFSSNAPKSSKPANSDTLEKGSEGSEVKKLQQRLKDLGYLEGTADGKFGDATETAVINFQKNNGLTADGKAGTATLNKIYSDEAKKWYGDSQYD